MKIPKIIWIFWEHFYLLIFISYDDKILLGDSIINYVKEFYPKMELSIRPGNHAEFVKNCAKELLELIK